MKILVMGTGAIGAYFGARLQEAGEEVVFCARGKNLLALKDRGLRSEAFAEISMPQYARSKILARPHHTI